MAKVIKLPFKSTGRFDLKPVRKKRAAKLEEHGQLNIFQQRERARVVSINEKSGSFESALRLHDQNIEEASNLYRKAIENGDHEADAYCNLGILESQKGNESAAIDCFTKALEKDPRHYEAQFNLANIYADAGNLKLAKLHYEVAREISDEDPNLHYKLADLELLKPVIENAESGELYTVTDGDHSFKVPKRSGKTNEEILEQLADKVSSWIKTVISA